jgi:hypothetical protein
MKLKLFVITTIVFTLTSCSSLFFANSTIEPIIFTKPIYRDSAFVSSYIGGKLNKSIFQNAYSDFSDISDNYYGQLNLSQTQTEEYYNLSYGAFGYLGKIGIANNIYDNGIYETIDYKNYFGGGVSADFQLSFPLQNIIFRPFGIRGSLQYENGEYLKYKRNDLAVIALVPDKFAISLSGTCGMDYKLRQSSIGVNLSVGNIVSLPNYIMDLGYAANLNYSTPKFTVFILKSGNLLNSNDDLVVGFNYKLP